VLKTAAFKWLGVLRVIAGLALLSLVFLVTPSRADVPALRLDPKLSFSERNFGGHLQAFHDPTGQLTQQQVASPPYAQQFEPIEDGFNGGYSSGAWWLRFQIQATQEEAAHPLKGGWWLRLGARYADYLDVWVPGEGADGATALVHRELGACARARRASCRGPFRRCACLNCPMRNRAGSGCAWRVTGR
jgi:hypothetical protein